MNQKINIQYRFNIKPRNVVSIKILTILSSKEQSLYIQRLLMQPAILSALFESIPCFFTGGAGCFYTQSGVKLPTA